MLSILTNVSTTSMVIGGIVLVQVLAIGGAIAAGVVPDKEKQNAWIKKNINSGVTTYKTGEVKMLMMLNKNKDGLAKGFTKDGTLKFETSIKEGKPYGITKEYYDNGKLRAELWEEDGFKHGLINFYDQDGNINNEMTLEEYCKLYDNDLEVFGKKDE